LDDLWLSTSQLDSHHRVMVPAFPANIEIGEVIIELPPPKPLHNEMKLAIIEDVRVLIIGLPGQR